MLKALLRKQFLELTGFCFQDKKTGKRRSKGKTAGAIALLVLVFALVAGVIAVYAAMLGSVLIPAGYDELYFAIFGLLAIVLAVLGSVFTTYAGLYRSKDNELLLSMPIPPMKILFVRMVGVYVTGLLYEALVLVPVIIVRWIISSPTVTGVIFPILLMFVLAFLALVLTCALGWVVALASTYVRRYKSLLAVAATLAIMAMYYLLYFRLMAYFQDVVNHLGELDRVMNTSLWLFGQFGAAAAGRLVPLIVFTAISAAAFAVTLLILSRSFVKIVTTSKSAAKAVYVERTAKVESVSCTLRRKELRRFLASPTYMLNTGLGIPIMLIAAGFLFIRLRFLHETIGELTALLPDSAAVYFIGTAIVMMITAMDGVTAPSVSLEGKNIWLLQSLPVRPWEVLRAKEIFHIELQSVPTFVLTVAVGCVLSADVITLVLMCVCSSLFLWFVADGGLIANLKLPKLTWTNETVPVKQSASVSVTIFGGWACIVIMAVPAIVFSMISAKLYLAVIALVLAAAIFLMRRWLRIRGAEIFSRL